LTHFDSEYLLSGERSKSEKITVRFEVKRRRKISPKAKEGGEELIESAAERV
jgi:hypothetical protein